MSPLPPMIPVLSKRDAALHVAMLSNDCMAVVDALADGANPRAAGATGMSIFDLAVRLGYVDIMAAMLHAGMDVDYQIHAGKSWSPLARAIEEDIAGLTTKRTALLLNYGARLDGVFHYNNKDGCSINDIFAARLEMAMPPEEVTINDLRELVDGHRTARAEHAAMLARKKALLARSVSRKFKL